MEANAPPFETVDNNIKLWHVSQSLVEQRTKQERNRSSLAVRNFYTKYPKAVGWNPHLSTESVPTLKAQMLGPASPSPLGRRTTAPGGPIGEPLLDLSPKSNIKANTRQLICLSQRDCSLRHVYRNLFTIGTLFDWLLAADLSVLLRTSRDGRLMTCWRQRPITWCHKL